MLEVIICKSLTVVLFLLFPVGAVGQVQLYVTQVRCVFQCKVWATAHSNGLVLPSGGYSEKGFHRPYSQQGLGSSHYETKSLNIIKVSIIYNDPEIHKNTQLYKEALCTIFSWKHF